LNAASLQMTVDLGSVPHVQRSVVNYGMPSVTGRAASSVNPDRMAHVIEGVIRQFEPRLSKVHVAAETAGAGGNQHEISFRIDAELWGQPAPHQVVLRTHIDTESGHVRVNDAIGG
jgi:type VI secretion system protein ImpF